MSDDPEMLTWPRWLGRAAAFGMVVGTGAAMFAFGADQGTDDLSPAAIAAIGAVFTVGGFVVGLWQQVRPTFPLFVRDVVWFSWPVWVVELVAVGGLGYLAGLVSR